MAMNECGPTSINPEGEAEKFEWSFLGDDEKERMCRSLDVDLMTSKSHDPDISRSPRLFDRSEPSLLEKKTKGDLSGLFGLEGSKVKESFKNKILSVWTNTKNGLLTKMAHDFKNVPEIWMLGKQYLNDLSSFKRDFSRLPWVSYRTGFPDLGSSNLTSDVGWGCMIRCAQMCLAITLNLHQKSQRVSSSTSSTTNLTEREILRLFGDQQHKECPFSIHALVSYGETIGRKAGTWFGPASISVTLRDVLKMNQTKHKILSNLSVYVAQDSAVYIRDVLEQMDGGSKAVMIIVPMRLGYDTLNEGYVGSIKEMFRWSYCVGVMGGRPKHSLYFVGCQGNELIYLDPHFSQDVVDLKVDNTETYHNNTPMKMNITKMDPTCSVAFYCSNVTELWGLVALVRESEEKMRRIKQQRAAVGNSSSLQQQLLILQFIDARHKEMVEPDCFDGRLEMNYYECGDDLVDEFTATLNNTQCRNNSIEDLKGCLYPSLNVLATSGTFPLATSTVVDSYGSTFLRHRTDFCDDDGEGKSDSLNRRHHYGDPFVYPQEPRDHRPPWSSQYFNQACKPKLNSTIHHYPQTYTANDFSIIPSPNNATYSMLDDAKDLSYTDLDIEADYSLVMKVDDRQLKSQSVRLTPIRRPPSRRNPGKRRMSREEDGFVLL